MLNLSPFLKWLKMADVSIYLFTGVEEKIPFQFVKITDKSAVITLNALTIGDVRQITGYMALYKKV